MILSVYTDGASRGNPGPRSIGVVICNDRGDIIHTHGELKGNGTNNTAEYEAIISGLLEVKQYNPAVVAIHSDSQVVIRQLNRMYQVRDSKLKALYAQTQVLLDTYFLGTGVVFNHVPRTHEMIQEADRICNCVLDGVPFK